ncbi:hypothetical protein CPB83DRAFT_310109 [Crepidotus variabilis]|uniref:Uncharacterized protein n=1 Tax=Crepidotus variabilis TaxID=179855 RepID=A0A9P6JQC6_9AGAR|nr:hypothetical protein CPB83DRAFT_310109 [Crepidotus variabilis]
MSRLYKGVLSPCSWLPMDSNNSFRRELTDQTLFGRDLSESEATEYVREIEDLYTRMPEEEAHVFIRELETDLETRSPSKIGKFFKKIWHGIKKVASVVIRREDEVAAREFDDSEIDARDVADDEDILAREYDDDLYERDMEVDEDLMQREFSDFEELD